MLSRHSACLLGAALLCACSDYNFASNKGSQVPPEDTGVVSEPIEEEGTPAVRLSSELLDLGVVCGVGDQEVLVLSEGDAPVEVTGVEVEGEGWTVVHDDLPVVLGPGETWAIGVSGSDGPGQLWVTTSDPSNPELTAELTAVADQPPTVSITSPGPNDILEVGAASRFEAVVTDDVDPPETLALQWRSDVDGLLGTDPADTGGLAVLDWQAENQSSGDHTVTLTATDGCEQTVTTQVELCQNEGYLAENLDLSTWNFEGNAAWVSSSSWVQLTTAGTNQSGTAFQTAAAVDAANVQIAFDFYASGGSGADGLSVTALDVARMTGFVGNSGGGIGFAGLPGWSIEVDTYYNSTQDPTSADHLSVHIDGDPGNSVAWTPLPDMEDGNWHRMEVTVNGTWLTVSIDGTTYLDQDVPQLSSFQAYVGFTAATGSLTNHHRIKALEVEEFVCEEPE